MGWGEQVAELLLKMFSGVKKRNKGVDSFLQVGRVTEIATRLVRYNRELQVDCFFLCWGHNGGDQFKYLSIVCGDFLEEHMPNFKFANYRFNELDEGRKKLLENIYKYKDYSLDLSEIKNDALRVNYDFEKIKLTRFYLLKYSKQRMWYLAIGTTLDGNKLNTPSHEFNFYGALNEIKTIIKNY